VAIALVFVTAVLPVSFSTGTLIVASWVHLLAILGKGRKKLFFTSLFLDNQVPWATRMRCPSESFHIPATLDAGEIQYRTWTLTPKTSNAKNPVEEGKGV